MKQLSIFLLILFSFQGFAQEEVEWFQQGQEWYYNVYCLGEYGCGYTYYEVSGNETVGGQEAKEFTRIYLDEGTEQPEVSTAYLRFENDTAWRYSAIAEEWYMLWDMGAEVGDVWTIQENVFYGYSDYDPNPEVIPLFKVVVDSVAFWDEVPDSPLTNRRMIYVSPVLNEMEESLYTFGPILEGVGPVSGSHDLLGNPTYTLLPLQSPYFQCFLDDGVLTYGSDELAFGSGSSPCFALGTDELTEVESGLIYPNPAMDYVKWDRPMNEITFMDATGKIVLRQQVKGSSNELSLDGLPRGFYTVVMNGEGGSFSQKLIVH
ncbi:MAG TPA: T9SS type A sorting domain-containing protein [Cryomorphaceae bacterium]|nr:T9SS type A sorting domain-containing protein [Cryomorphaceae bacterium]